MTLKKQFIALISTIIIIPVVCLLFILIFISVKSPHRLLIGGYQHRLENLSIALNENDLETAEKIDSTISDKIEFIIVDDTGAILMSRFPEIKAGFDFNLDYFKILMSKTLQDYIYHFNKKSTDNRTFFIISRTDHNYIKIRRYSFYIPHIIIALFIFITLCCILISIITRTIFNSIITIKNETAELATGNLSKQIRIIYNGNEITEISKSLESMRLSLLEVQNQKNKFVIGLSHDLRTPVSIIRGYTEAIKDGVITGKDDILNANELILTKITQLQGMINTLIDFMKFDSNEIKKNMELHSITRVINNFVNEAKLTGNVFNRIIEIKEELVKDDIFIFFDEQLIIRVLENLFNNALRYTKDNDIISFSSYIKDKTLFFSIKDTGIGIPKKDINNIFNLFFRGTNSRREEGIGIGLSVVKNIVDIHGWNISVESEHDKGSCFTIAIPITEAS